MISDAWLFLKTGTLANGLIIEGATRAISLVVKFSQNIIELKKKYVGLVHSK
jgi:hypothetical protein